MSYTAILGYPLNVAFGSRSLPEEHPSTNSAATTVMSFSLADSDVTSDPEGELCFDFAGLSDWESEDEAMLDADAGQIPVDAETVAATAAAPVVAPVEVVDAAVATAVAAADVPAEVPEVPADGAAGSTEPAPVVSAGNVIDEGMVLRLKGGVSPGVLPAKKIGGIRKRSAVSKRGKAASLSKRAARKSAANAAAVSAGVRAVV